MYRNSKYFFSMLFYLSFLSYLNWILLIPVAALGMCLWKPKATTVIFSIGSIITLFLSALFSITTYPLIISLGLVFAFLLYAKKENHRVAFYFCLVWLFLLAYFAGPFAGLCVVFFLLLVAVLLKKAWILLFMLLLFLPVVPMTLIPLMTTDPGEEASMYRIEEEAYRQLSEGDTEKQAQGEPDGRSVIEWSFDEKIPSLVLEICRWICMITGSIFVIAAVKYIYEKRRGTKEMLKRAGITAAIAGAVFIIAFAIARIPPRDKPIEFGAAGGVGGIGTYSLTGGQDPFFLEGEGSGKISVQKIDFPFSGVAITITLAVIVLISVLLIKYLYRKPVPLTHESKKEEEKEGKENEAFSFNETGEALVKKAYQWIRRRKYQYLEFLTPGELADRFPSENLKTITEDFVRVEYGFGKTELPEKEIRRIVTEETGIPENRTIQSEPQTTDE